MLRQGEYAVWFRTSRGTGTGKVFLKDGKIFGSDPIIDYRGSYTVSGDYFTIVLATRRHTAGYESLLGTDEVDLTLEGKVTGEFACCSGMAGTMKIDVTLIPVRAEESTPVATYRTEDFRPERLPRSKTR